MSTATVTDNRVVCHCLGVTESQVQDALDFGGSQNLKDVRDCTGAGSGCTACHRRIIGMLSDAGVEVSEAYSPI